MKQSRIKQASKNVKKIIKYIKSHASSVELEAFELGRKEAKQRRNK